MIKNRIRLSTQLHAPKVKVTAPPLKKRKFGTLGVLALRKENTVKIQTKLNERDNLKFNVLLCRKH
jgi:hypothetical protein